MKLSDQDYRDGDVVLPACVQRMFYERTRRRDRIETGAELRDVGGVGQVVP
jgi:hypothetical protein